MKIILDIPDSVVPSEIEQLINSGNDTKKQDKLIMRMFLELALSELENCDPAAQQAMNS